MKERKGTAMSRRKKYGDKIRTRFSISCSEVDRQWVEREALRLETDMSDVLRQLIREARETGIQIDPRRMQR